MPDSPPEYAEPSAGKGTRPPGASSNGYVPPPDSAPPAAGPGGPEKDTGPADADPTRGNGRAATTEAASAASASAASDEEAASEVPRRGFTFDPLAPYKGAFRRFFTVYRHVIGLLMGGVLAYVRALPPGERGGFNHLPARMAAFLVRPLVKRDLRDVPFAKQLRRRLEILGPTFVKLGQIMALREDLLPREITSELSNLLDRLPEVPFAQVKGIIERDLGRPMSRHFRHVYEKPLGSASIAQAHRAQTRTGDDVVVKVIKPGIREVMTADLKLLEAVGALLQWLLPRYQPQQIIEEFISYTEKELDYNFEAENAEIFAANFDDQPDIVFPEIYRDLSSDDVLTMEYLDGVKPGTPESLQLSEAVRERVVDLGAEAIICMLYRDGFFHADLHAGNLLILDGEDPVKVGFIDLGMVGRFGKPVKRRLLYYFHSLVRGDIENATRYLVEMARLGEESDPHGFQRALNDLARRFRTQRGRVSVAQLILESLSLGGKYRVFFPVEMTLMVKALVTYEGVGRMMDPEIDVPEVSRKHITRIFRERFDPRFLGQELLSSAPEMIDLAMQLPQLVSSGAARLEHRPPRQTSSRRSETGLRSAVLSGACLLGGTIAVVQGGPWYLWTALFLAGLFLAVVGKS